MNLEFALLILVEIGFLIFHVLFCRRRHKFDCLCAICVLKRRRREREENDRIAKSQNGADDDKLDRDLKQEVCSNNWPRTKFHY